MRQFHAAHLRGDQRETNAAITERASFAEHDLAAQRGSEATTGKVVVSAALTALECVA